MARNNTGVRTIERFDDGKLTYVEGCVVRLCRIPWPGRIGTEQAHVDEEYGAGDLLTIVRGW